MKHWTPKYSAFLLRRRKHNTEYRTHTSMPERP